MLFDIDICNVSFLSMAKITNTGWQLDYPWKV